MAFKSIVLFPLVFALFPALSLFSTNLNQLVLVDMINSGVVSILLLCLVGTALIWAFVYFLIKDVGKSALITFLAQILFFSYGHVRLLFERLFISLHKDMNPNHVEAPLFLALMIGGSYAISKIRLHRKLPELLNVVSITVVLVAIANIAINARTTFAAQKPIVDQSPSERAVSDQPSVYYIILDAFGRQDILKKHYGYDDSDFIDSLKQLGFYVADQSKANYPFTVLSLASSLNSEYLPTAKDLGVASDDVRAYSELVQSNRTFRYFKDRGYKTVAFWTGFASITIRRADILLQPGDWALSEFQTMFIQLTPLPMFLNRTANLEMFDSKRKKIRFALENLSKVARIPGPKLVYAHFVCPHFPFVFNADGTETKVEHKTYGLDPVAFKVAAPEKFREGYVNQAKFISNEILKIVSVIIKESPDSHIIIQSDHGPDLNVALTGKKNGISALRERMGILNAYYFPSGKEALYPGISPVNTFRVLINQLFQEKQPLLNDRSFFSDMKTLGNLEEITEQVKDVSEVSSN